MVAKYFTEIIQVTRAANSLLDSQQDGQHFDKESVFLKSCLNFFGVSQRALNV